MNILITTLYGLGAIGVIALILWVFVEKEPTTEHIIAKFFKERIPLNVEKEHLLQQDGQPDIKFNGSLLWYLKRTEFFDEYIDELLFKLSGEDNPARYFHCRIVSTGNGYRLNHKVIPQDQLSDYLLKSSGDPRRSHRLSKLEYPVTGLAAQ